MAFEKKTWKNRLSEFPGRRLLSIISKTDTEMVVDVTRHEGEVSQDGDAFSAANMNDLEQRIAEEFENVNNNLDTLTANTVNSKDTTLITAFPYTAPFDGIISWSCNNPSNNTFGIVDLMRNGVNLGSAIVFQQTQTWMSANVKKDDVITCYEANTSIRKPSFTPYK